MVQLTNYKAFLNDIGIYFEAVFMGGDHLWSFAQYSKIVPPGGASGKEPACQCWRPKISLSQEDPLEKEMATYSSILA